MPDSATLNKSVYELLDESRIAREAAKIAAENGNRVEMRRLKQKSRDLNADAHTLDPRHECAAWAGHLRGTN